jgi:IS30 family transposase
MAMPRKHFTNADRTLIWDRWRQGESLHQIGQRLATRHSSIRQVLVRTGGIRPPVRHRSVRALTLAEREEISRSVALGRSLRTVAEQLQRAPSTISREIQRNGGRERYRANHADERAWRCACRPKTCKLGLHPALAKRVAAKLQKRWSPVQIAGWLKKRSKGNEERRVSHETIYRSLFIQARGALKKDLLAHLRHPRAMRRSRHHTQKTATHGQLTDMVSIRERPAEVEDRALPGHWEGDLLMGGHHSQIATLVERHTRYVMLVKIPSKDTKTVIDALIKHAHKLPRELYRSLTWDRGKEMGEHRRFTLATDIQVYFCDPQHPWQRGSNENTNGLLRQYFPKGTDLSGYTQAKLDAVARELNGRPRQTLDFDTPAERFQQCVALTG